MAANVFRQQCPSCETMVLIKDRKQIGKKIDCPKCKYRFLVEDSEPEAVEVVEVVEEESPKAKPKADAIKKPAAGPVKGDAKPAPAKKKPAKVSLDDDDDDDGNFKSKPKKQGAGMMVIVGGVTVAILAIGVLGVGGYFMFLTGDGNTGPITRKLSTATEQAKVDNGEVKVDGPKLVNITNLLPNDTDGVYRLNVKTLLRSMVGQAAFDTPGAFQRRVVEEKIGLKLDEVDELVIAQHFRKGWVFAAVRTAKPVDVDAFKTKLGLLPAPDGPIKKYEYFVTPPSTWLDNLSRIMAEVNGATLKPEPLKAKTLAVYLFDPQTLILADPEPLKAFLEADTRPAHLAKPEPPKPGQKPSNQYLTVRQPLKNVLDRIEARPPILASVAWDLTAYRDTLVAGVKVLQAMKLADQKTVDLVDDMKAVGMALHMREHSTVYLGAEGGDDLGKKVQAEFRALAQAFSQAGAIVDLDGAVSQPPPPPPGKLAAPGPRYVIRSVTQDKVPVFSIEIQMPPPDGNALILRNVLRPQMVLLRGLVEMADGGQRIFDLAGTVGAGIKQEKTFPRGTLERKGMNFGRPFPPDQRISWMAGLLPYLGYENLAREINPERSWRPEWDGVNKRMVDDNARLGAVLIPAFLDPTAPASTWWVKMPSVPEHSYAATHYVGMAGVGLDAATYSADDPIQAKKMGIFGYDRVARPEDIKDGLSNTIMIIQVPPTYKRPWIAGGGATVSGVPEKKSIEPFVATKRGDKRGTYVLLADGSVRFISADISDEVFKAMCTINGGEKVDLEKNTVPVPPDAKPVPAAQR